MSCDIKGQFEFNLTTQIVVELRDFLSTSLAVILY